MTAVLTAADTPPPDDGLPPGQPYVSPDDLSSIPPLFEAAAQQALLPLVAQIFQESAGKVHAQLVDAADLPNLPSVSSLAAETYLAQAANTFAQVGDDLWNTARSELLAGFQNGESIPQLSDRLRNSAGLTARKATLVARTQVLDASNAGSYLTAQTAGIDGLRKGWLDTPDQRTRETHRIAGARYSSPEQMIPLADQFTVGGYSCDRPHDPTLPIGERASCRCALIYSMGPAAVRTAQDEAAAPQAPLPNTSGQPELPVEVTPAEAAAAQAAKISEATASPPVTRQLAHQATLTPRAMTDLDSVHIPGLGTPDGDAYLASKIGAAHGYYTPLGSHPSVYATAEAATDNPLPAIWFNPHWNEARLGPVVRKSIDSGWYTPAPEGLAPLERTLAHEYGHHVTNVLFEAPNFNGTADMAGGIAQRLLGPINDALGANRLSPFARNGDLLEPIHWGVEGDLHFSVHGDLLDEWVRQNRDLIAAKVSGYGAKNFDEFLAEVWQEYSTMGAGARPHIQTIGVLLRDVTEELRAGGGILRTAVEVTQLAEAPLSTRTVIQLRALAKERGIPGYAKLTKPQLVERLSEAPTTLAPRFTVPAYRPPLPEADVDRMRRLIDIDAAGARYEPALGTNYTGLIGQSKKLSPADAEWLRTQASAHHALYSRLWQKRAIGREFDSAAARLGISPEALKAQSVKQFTETVAGKPIGIRTTDEGLASILSDGRFKTQFEAVRRAELEAGSSTRAEAEEAIWGYGPGTDPAVRPIYGYVMPDGITGAGVTPDDFLSYYGRTQVVLRKDVLDRTSASWNDSLDNFTQTRPAPIFAPTWEASYPGNIDDLLARVSKGDSYIEAQVHGGVKVVDIAEVVFPSEPGPALQAALAEKSIPWRVVPSGAKAAPLEPAAPVLGEVPLAKRRIGELRTLAKERGLTVPPRATKADLVRALEAPPKTAAELAAEANAAKRAAARERNKLIESRAAAEQTLAELDDLLFKKASREAFEQRIALAQLGPADLAALRAALGDPVKLRAQVTRISKKQGITVDGKAGSKVKFDPATMDPVGEVPAPGTPMVVIRRGSTITVDGEEVLLNKAVVKLPTAPVKKPAKAAPKKAAAPAMQEPALPPKVAGLPRTAGKPKPAAATAKGTNPSFGSTSNNGITYRDAGRADERWTPDMGPLPSGAFEENCTNVVHAFEMRMRGFDVQAGPLDVLDKYGYASGRTFRQVDDLVADAYRLPDGTPHGRTFAGQNWRSFAQVDAEIERDWPEGGRGFITVGKHVFNVVKTRGKAQYIEAQFDANKSRDVTVLYKRKYRSEGVFSGGIQEAKVIRLDDLVPTDAILQTVTAAGS